MHAEPDRQRIEQLIRGFLAEGALEPEAVESLSGKDSLRQAGIIDSFGVLSLVTFLEQTFSIQIRDEEVVPENLDSVDSLVAFVAGKTSGGAA